MKTNARENYGFGTKISTAEGRLIKVLIVIAILGATGMLITSLMM